VCPGNLAGDWIGTVEVGHLGDTERLTCDPLCIGPVGGLQVGVDLVFDFGGYAWLGVVHCASASCG
jgi:hypothetical protein